MREFRRSATDGHGDQRSTASARDARVRRVIAEAAQHIPFYRDFWAGQGILRAAERGNISLSDLPCLTRRHLQDGFSSMHHPGFTGAVVERSTGGSSGQPVRFIQSRHYLDAATGRGMRTLAWSGWQPGARTAFIWGGPTELRAADTYRQRFKELITNRRLFDAFRADDARYDAWLDTLVRWRPEFIIGYASALVGLSERAAATGIALPTLRAVFSTAERLLPEHRARIVGAFGAPVRDQYGSREIQALAAECSHGTMHAYLDSAVLELGAPIGDARPILVTQLDNPAMPLIRYENGDLSQWTADPPGTCPCGLIYPALDGIRGRMTDLFHFPGGRIVHGEYFTHLMYDITGVRAFQFRQDRTGGITLYLVLAGNVDQARITSTLHQRLSGLLVEIGATAAVSIKVAEEIPPVGEGKFRFTISEYAP